jgi:DNA-binding IclR family transcriptional regulator
LLIFDNRIERTACLSMADLAQHALLGGRLMDDNKSAPLERYLAVLEAVATASKGLSLSEIAERCALPVGSTHRLLQNLQGSGLITTDGTKRKDYRLGERLLRLLHAGSDDAWLKISVQPVLDALANDLGETCFVTRLVGHQIISLAWAVPTSGLQGYVFPGHIMPPHAAASAKAILAFQPKSIVDKALSGELPKLTPKTKVARTSIDREHTRVREAGYATCINEMEPGVGALAIPIEVPDVGVVYSLGVSSLIDRLNRRSINLTIERMRAAADNLSRALGDLSSRSLPRASARLPMRSSSAGG